MTTCWSSSHCWYIAGFLTSHLPPMYICSMRWKPCWCVASLILLKVVYLPPPTLFIVVRQPGCLGTRLVEYGLPVCLQHSLCVLCALRCTPSSASHSDICRRWAAMSPLLPYTDRGPFSPSPPYNRQLLCLLPRCVWVCACVCVHV